MDLEKNKTRPQVVLTALPVATAFDKFFTKYFENQDIRVNFHSSQASKLKSEKEFYDISFSYDLKNLVPSFVLDKDYANILKEEFSSWLKKEVSYFSIDWSLSLSSSNKEPNLISFAITMRL